jgi:hypothetical protein
MEPDAKGSEMAMLAAQQVAIGARICTVRASKTIGNNFRNRRRMNQSTFSFAELNHAP